MTGVTAKTRCRALIAGFGRPGMRDLDFGRQLIRYLDGLSWADGVVVEDLSYAAPMVLHRLQELDPAKVVLVGAAARGFDVPGSLRRYRLDLEPPQSDTVRRSLEESVQGVVDVDHTLAVARHFGALPPETVVIEVEPADCSFGLGFSEELGASFDAMVALVREEVGCGGDEPVHRDLEVLRPGTPSQTTSPRADDAEPSADLAALVRYADQHREARLVAPHRGTALVDGHLGLNGLEAVTRSRPWGVNVDVGGDWCDVIPLEEDWYGCVVGDVAGRGVEATAAMADLRSAVRAYAVAEGRSPGRVLDRLDRLARATQLGADTTMIYVAVHPPSGEVRLSNAGHCPPLLLTRDGDTRFLRVALGQPLGMTPGADRPEEHFVLAPASTLLLFTDGLVHGARESMIDGLERLRRSAVLAPTEPDDLCDHVVACMSDVKRDDDMCLLALRRL